MILQINLEENCVLYQISIDLFNLKKNYTSWLEEG